MLTLKDTFQQRVGKIKYNYMLLLHPEKIEIPEDFSEIEKNKYIKKIYQDKAKIHEKLGAKKFQKFIKKFDKAKFKFIKKIIKENRAIKWCDKEQDIITRKKLKKAKTEAEKKEIIDDMRRGKILVRKQIKEERSINYYQGVDNRIENFDKYITRNKEIHKNALKVNGLLLGVSIGLGVIGVPVLPFVLGGYQVLAGFKNFQCINAQSYYLSMMNMRKKAMVKKQLTEIKKMHDENPDLIASIQKGREEGKDFYNKQDILDSIDTIAGLQQLKKRLIAARERQMAIIKESESEIPKPIDTILEKMILPLENSNESQTTKAAVRK